MSGFGEFKFLNVAGKLENSDAWNAPDQNKLWLYNLHYFDDLNATDASSREDWHRALISCWIAENPAGKGNGWEPYPSSLRIVNWIKWGMAGYVLEAAWQQSLAVQVRYLSQQLEYHLMGNHLFVNAKALVFAGLYFQGDEADVWLQTGLKILKREMPEQILADGGQFELSPMYHALALEDVLDLINISTVYADRISEDNHAFIASLQPLAVLMLIWMRSMNHTDGELSFFNDSALGIAPSSQQLEAYALRMGVVAGGGLDNFIHLKQSGYIRVQRPNWLCLLDVARIGSDYLPGHAHADTLSFELSAFGQRVLVNSGISRYGADEERLRQRGTAAHNTVVINGENSSEVWSGFRVARRAKPVALEINQGDDVLKISCSHDGYQRLPGKPVHHRQWDIKDSELTVADTIFSAFDTAEARFHFHPGVVLEPVAENKSGKVFVGEGRELYWEVLDGDAVLEATQYHPEFGLSQDNQCLVVRFVSDRVSVRFYGFGGCAALIHPTEG